MSSAWLAGLIHSPPMAYIPQNVSSVGEAGKMKSRERKFLFHVIAQGKAILTIVYDVHPVGFHPTFSCHGIVQASLTLLIWLNENVHLFA